MAYGEGMTKLSPCGDELICAVLDEFCPGAQSLLDLGCGRGDRLASLAERFPGCALAGVDCDGDMVEAARKKVSADIRLADAGALPFEGESFDVALCECSLSLFSQPERSLGEAHRVLKSGGVLILGDLYARLEIVPAPEQSCGGVIGAIYARGNIELMAEEAGFELLRYSDRSGDLAAMSAQMIFDGSFCDCLGPEGVGLLRRVKAGYGLWIFKKEET